MSFKLDFYYNIIRKAGEKGSIHHHGFFEIVYYEDGYGYTTVDGKKFRYSPGTLAFIPPNTPHDEYCETDTNIYVVNFSLSGQNKNALPSGLYSDKARTAFNCISKISDEYAYSMPYMSEFNDIFCNELYYSILRSISKSEEKYGSIDYVITYINRFCCENLKVTDLADMCGYSERHFREIFKEKTGCTPLEYIFAGRIEKAKGMLTFTNESIVNTASVCGFCSSSQFANLFKKQTGLSPKEFRKSKKQNMHK